jgi:plastocyanin
VTDSNGVAATDSNTILTATAAHDAPVITSTAGNQQTTDTATIRPFSGIAISDVDFGQTETVTVILPNLANGTLSNPGGFLNNGTYTVTGSDAAVSAAVSGLVFTPTAHQVAPGGTVTTSFSISVTDTAGDTATGTPAIVVSTATHNPLSLTGTKAGQTVSDEATLSPFAGVTVNDLDFGQTETMTVSMSSPANGVLTSLGKGAYDASTGIYSVTGDVSQVAQSLRGLVFAPAAHQVVPGGTVATNFTIAVTDTAGDHASDSSTGVVATAATDPPVITGAQLGQPVSDEAAVAPFAGISINDADFGQTETVTVTLSALANGTLTNHGTGAYDRTTGVYTVTGTDAAVTQSLRGLVFGPAAHQVAPGGTVTTGFTLTATDTAGATTTINTISVAATAVNDPPAITQTKVNLGSPNQDSQTPFAALVITDPDVGHIDTVSVTPSDPTAGALSNASDGSVDTKTGVYTATGTASQVTAALNRLVFTPFPPANGYIATTSFAVIATGPGGVATDDTIMVTSVTQVLGLAGNPSSNDQISVSTNGGDFAPAAPDKTNQAVVAAPLDGGSYALPAGYQAAYLGGSADASLTDASAGGALLVGNTGNSTISSGAAGDTLTGGAGRNTFIVSGANDVVGVTGNSAVSTSGSSATVFAGAGNVTLADSGTGSDIGLGSGTASVTLSGSGAAVFAGGGGASVVDTGSGDRIGGFTGGLTATLAGSGSSVYGGSGMLSIDVASTSSAAMIGTGLSDAQISIAGAATTVYGGGGSLNAAVTGDHAVIGLDTGPASMTLSGAAAQIFGGSGQLSILDLGSADTIGAGIGSTTVTASGSDVVAIGGGGVLLFVGGAGEATVYGGTGATTVAGGTGATTLYGGGDGAITWLGGSGLATYQAGAGNETLNGAASTADTIINGGIDQGGHDRLMGGTGNDSLYAGTGADTFSGGGGADQFVFYKSVIAGSAPADVITDFNVNDSVYLAGYGADAAANAVSAAVASGGASTITLSDNTRITFLGVADLGALGGRVVSF